MPDGRQISFATYTSGKTYRQPVVLYCHSTLGSALEAPPGIHTLSYDSQILVPERPGFGESSATSSPGLLAWVHDAIELIDALEIDEIRVAGYSGGAPYALACAYVLKERVKEVFLFSPHGPLDAPNASAGMCPSLLAMFDAARQYPDQLQAQLEGQTQNLESTLNGFLSEMALADQTIGARPEVRAALLRNLQQAIRNGLAGLLADLHCLVKPWGFPLTNITASVKIWQGDADRNTPPAMAEYLSEVLPNASLFRMQGAGHLAVFSSGWTQTT